MLNRRFLRVKALQEIYAYHQAENTNLEQAERRLLEGVDNLYELFVYQVSFLVELKKFAERRIEENLNKNFPTAEDLNPNMKFVNNRILKALDDNRNLMEYEEKHAINWADYREDFIRSCYNRLVEYPEYKDYMNNGEDSFADDKRFLVSVIDTYMADDASLYDFFAALRLSFSSDYQIAVFLLWKFINEMPSSFNENSKLPPVYKTENDEVNEDREFVVKLFRGTILHADEYMQIVKDNISNWEYDRLALMDKILIFMALTEFLELHFIPVKVTINEYIELSKFYSTPDSRRFVNGMLDKISQQLKADGRMKKTGPGLIDK